MIRLIKLMEAQGLTAKQMQSVIAGIRDYYMGYVPKHRFDEVNEMKKQLAVDIKERERRLEDLEQMSGDSRLIYEQIVTSLKQSSNDCKSLQVQIDRLICELQSNYLPSLERAGANLNDLPITTA